MSRAFTKYLGQRLRLRGILSKDEVLVRPKRVGNPVVNAEIEFYEFWRVMQEDKPKTGCFLCPASR